VTMIAQIMFTLLGAAIGFSTINPLQEQNPTEGLALGSGIWLLVSALISVWVGACVAGRLSGGPRRADGMLHGIVTWSVATFAAWYLLATATGALLGGAGALLGNVLSLGNTPAGEKAMATQGPLRGIVPQAANLLPPTGRTEVQPAQLAQLAKEDPEVGVALARMEANGGAAKATQDRDQVVQMLVNKHNMNQQEAANLVSQWDQQAQQLENQASQKARQAGQTAAHGISKGALWAFIALILGMLVSAWGGWAGAASVPRTTQVTGPVVT
jgi:hypothetical protein